MLRTAPTPIMNRQVQEAKKPREVQERRSFSHSGRFHPHLARLGVLLTTGQLLFLLPGIGLGIGIRGVVAANTAIVTTTVPSHAHEAATPPRWAE